jgi:hypothetical protein
VLSHTQNPVLFYWMLKMLFNSSKKKVIHDSIHFSISRDLDSQLLQISLRGVIADSEDTIKAAADSLGRHGFINYFGLQVLP